MSSRVITFTFPSYNTCHGTHDEEGDSSPVLHVKGVFQNGSLEKLRLGTGKQEVSLVLLPCYLLMLDLILKP